jgi:ribonuclease HII
MHSLHQQFPNYGWLTNKGYSTEEHVLALNRFGPSVHHRRSFAPVYEILRPIDSREAFLTSEEVSPLTATPQ